ncbi:aminotransferase class I/II-fold pyridoxal phosphate-dependent enzyme [Kribbella sp. NBC_01505]|uniref:aminotransferase class I/II-fold pyridoxal phosphate-dependent enzyme n=1 Tax=Kribbella sp. NBC_01505 TaxID=2903580 RepID=UPI003870B20E
MTAVDDPSQVVMDIFSIGEALGVIHASAEDEQLDGRIVTVDGRRTVNFSSCGYTGLEMHPALKAAVAEAVHRYGTQFSSTRTFLSSPQYPAAEAALTEMFGRPTAISASTSMGNMSAIPTLVGAGDVVLLDSQVHRSVRMAVKLADAPVHAIPHSDVDVLERRIRQLSEQYDRVWYMADGLYSMFGDFLPAKELSILAERYPKLWLYVDDAHSISWTGRHGRGHALEQLSPTALQKTVMIASLNKSFGIAGGAMTFPDDAMRHRVFSVGWPMIFSGPVPPPMLAGILASARLHLSAEHSAVQARVLSLIRLFNAEAAAHRLPVVNQAETPIRYVTTGNTVEGVCLVGRRLQEAGFFVNTASYPAVPVKRSGIRIAITAHQTEADVIGLVQAVADILASDRPADEGIAGEALLSA